MNPALVPILLALAGPPNIILVVADDLGWATSARDPDVKALLRLAVLYDVPAASNRATADCIVDSGLLEEA